MQPEAQTTTHGSLAVSAGALEIAIVIQGALEVFWLYLYLLYQYSNPTYLSYVRHAEMCLNTTLDYKQPNPSISTIQIVDIRNGHYLLISTIRIADINNVICWYRQLVLWTSTIYCPYCRYSQLELLNCVYRHIIVDFHNWNCWYQQWTWFVDIDNSNCRYQQLNCRYQHYRYIVDIDNWNFSIIVMYYWYR